VATNATKMQYVSKRNDGFQNEKQKTTLKQNIRAKYIITCKTCGGGLVAGGFKICYYN